VMRAAEIVLSKGGAAPSVEHVACADVMTPADRYQDLFVAVQSSGISPDSKNFVDCIPSRHPEEIMREYGSFRENEGFDLSEFVRKNFVHEPTPAHQYVSDPDQPLGDISMVCGTS
jgi:alpha,alpha-trehalase